MRSHRAHRAHRAHHASHRRMSLRKKGGKGGKRRAAPSRKTARGHQQSSAAKIFPPIDIRSKKDITEALKRIMEGPITILLVYADWCGHCHDMMPHWKRAVASPDRSVQSIALNEANTESFNQALSHMNHNTSSIHVSGYPTVLVLNQKGNKITEVQAKKDTASLTQLMNQSGPLAEQAGLATSPPVQEGMQPMQEEPSEEEPSEEGLATKGDSRDMVSSFEPTSLPLASPPRLSALPEKRLGGALLSKKARGGLYRLLHPRTRRRDQ